MNWFLFLAPIVGTLALVVASRLAFRLAPLKRIESVNQVKPLPEPSTAAEVWKSLIEGQAVAVAVPGEVATKLGGIDMRLLVTTSAKEGRRAMMRRWRLKARRRHVEPEVLADADKEAQASAR